MTKTVSDQLVAPWNRIAAAAAALLMSSPAGAALAECDPAAYKAAVPALEQAGGERTCVSCFLEKYAPAPFSKAFAVSKDGAYGGWWQRGISIDEARNKALDSCRKKPSYTSANPCVVFFENDTQVWMP